MHSSGLRQWAERWRLSGGPGVSLEAPEGGALPPLPAATEVAAYRIAQEAVTNALRHADASRCVVRLGPDEGETNLFVEVRDDGRGIGDVRGSDRKVRGFGLRSMRERAEELGGTFEAAPAPGGGTRVRAVLPLRPGSGPVEAGGVAP